jgi:glycosyltransferase involved in cell wall biosynthesis
LIVKKQKASIIWVARLIDWKHPEICVEVAKRLKLDGYNFNLNMIGTGELEKDIQQLIEKEKLVDCVKMLGSMKPDQVREHMEKSQIFMFTSDRGEGWGAVLNESMNSACAVVASHAIGSVPFLIDDAKNGYIYKDGDVDDLYKKIKLLLDNDAVRDKISKNAYYTMISEWNAENAVNKLLSLVEHILTGEKDSKLFTEGVCSKAKAIKDNWYKVKTQNV